MKLYRIGGRLAIMAILSGAALAQAPSMKTRHDEKPAAPPTKPKTITGPRAIAVLQWVPTQSGSVIRRLVPVSIFDDGKFYDASLYMADPVPMSLGPGVVYDVEREGESIGLFTITAAQQQKDKWMAAGKWSPNGNERPAFAKRERPQAAPKSSAREVTSAETKPEVAPGSGNANDRRDRSRTTTTVYDEEGKPETPEQADQDTRPTLKRNKADQNGRPARVEVKPSSTSTEDADRPQLQRGELSREKPAAIVPEEQAPASASDPDRPRLRRGRQDQGPSSDAVPALPGNAQNIREAAAVSDAVQTESRHFHLHWTEADRHAADEKLARVVQAQITKYMKSIGAPLTMPASYSPPQANPPARGGAHGRRRPEYSPAPVVLADGELRAFDLFGNNDPVLVYSATANVRRTTYYATIVARLDLEGSPRVIFSSVTDDSHLDVYPRMQLIDAVDADRSKRGSLLFRRTSADGKEFVLYKVGLDGLSELFHGGEGD